MKESKNTGKQERYALLCEKLNKAIKNEFWMEACMIEYAIIEDRTLSILYHAGIYKDNDENKHKLSNKLNSIEYQIGKRHFVIYPKVNLELIREIKVWKDKRNAIVHRACNSYKEEVAKEVALTGKDLVRRISNDSAKVTRLAAKLLNRQ